jgi:hypothetical protein
MRTHTEGCELCYTSGKQRKSKPTAEHTCRPIVFAEWGYLGKGKFQRRDFRLDILAQSSAFSAEDSLFAHLGMHEIFTPTKTYPPMNVTELVAATEEATL